MRDKTDKAAPGSHVEEGLSATAAIPPNGILTRKLFEAPHLKVVLFNFAAGQELSEHTATLPATLYFIRGEADVVPGEDTQHAAAGTFIHMDAHLKHAIRAKTETVMLLTLFREAGGSSPATS